MQMKSNPTSDIVSQQYSRWMYPQPILDISVWAESNWQWFDPSHAHRIFWPDREYKPDLDILVAGCGTNQAAIIAYNNPDARVVAIDISQPSLDHHTYLQAKHRLDNLELRLLPIEDAQKLGRDFDLIMSTGVLHHLASPERGMAALASCLRPDGVAAIMLYAKSGRAGVEMLQSVFREMKLGQNDTSLLMVREALKVLPKDHPLRSYLSLAPDLQYDAGLVDTFLHGRDRSYTVNDCIELVSSSGLVFQDIFMKTPYYPPQKQRSAFYAAVAELPDQRQWSIMERINPRNACHFFMACHADRPAGSYAVNFDGEDYLSYVPHYRYRCGFNGQEIYKPGWKLDLGPAQAAMARLIDGHLTIAEIADAASDAARSVPAIGDPALFAKELFRSLWQTDYITSQLPGQKSPKSKSRLRKTSA
jgi:SAM-dependent methyltransferase